MGDPLLIVEEPTLSNTKIGNKLNDPRQKSAANKSRYRPVLLLWLWVCCRRDQQDEEDDDVFRILWGILREEEAVDCGIMACVCVCGRGATWKERSSVMLRCLLWKVAAHKGVENSGGVARHGRVEARQRKSSWLERG